MLTELKFMGENIHVDDFRRLSIVNVKFSKVYAFLISTINVKID